MSVPPAGQYFIYNRVLDPAGDKLAITFVGENNTVTVTPLTNAASQVWTVTNYNATTFELAPASAGSLQIGWGGSGPTPMPPGSYTWTIANGPAGYTIQDGGKTQNWFVASAAINGTVSIGADQGTERYRWVLQPAK